MKIFKRVSAAAIAAVICASAGALSACNGGGNKASAKDVAKILAALNTQQTVYLETTGLTTTDGTATLTYLNADGSVVVGQQSQVVEMTGSQTTEMKFDLASGSGDSITETSSESSTINNGLPQTNISHSKSYEFLRNGHSFSYNLSRSGNSNNFNDFNDVEEWNSDVRLNYSGMQSGDAFEILGEDYSIVSSDAVSNKIVIQLAYETDSLKIKKGKATVDVNKLADTALAEISEAFNSFSASTTIGTVLENKAVKKYIGAILNTISPEELLQSYKDYLAQYMSEEEAEAIMSAITVLPDEGSTTYDYYVKIIKSSQLNDALNELLFGASGIILPTTLENVTIGFIISMFNLVSGGTTATPDLSADDLLKEAQEYLSDLSEKVTPTKIEVYEEDDYRPSGYEGELGGTTTTISNFKVEYILDKNFAITAESASFEMTLSSVSVSKYNSYVYYKTETVQTAVTTEQITYLSSSPALTDISASTTSMQTYGELEGEYSFSVYIYSNKIKEIISNIIGENYEVSYVFSISFTEYFTVADGKITDTRFSDGDNTTFEIEGTPEEGTFTIKVEALIYHLDSNGERLEDDWGFTISETIEVPVTLNYTIKETSTNAFGRCSNIRAEVTYVTPDNTYLLDYNTFGTYRYTYINTVGGIIAGTEWTRAD